MRILLILLFLFISWLSFSQASKNNAKKKDYAAEIKKSLLPSTFEIKQILPEVTKKCGFWSYKFIFTDGKTSITYTGNANILDELIRKALKRCEVGASFFIEAKSSSCKNIIGKRYKILVVE
ncbi:MAG: hypothetical protein SFY56_00320 [Bacteroidota bacterium]|nr:hypothetical protein [Bacteroidota bacterium]